MNSFKLMKYSIAFSLISCSKEGDYIDDRKVFASPEITLDNVTYQNFVEPLLTKNCASCHGVASMLLH